MPDITIPDAAVEAAAKADYERWRHPGAPTWEDADEGIRQQWRDTESVPLTAAAPYIAAQALRDYRDHIALTLPNRVLVSTAVIHAELNARIDRTEPDHG